MYYLIEIVFIFYIINGDWGLGIGDWGFGSGPQPPTPNPHPPCPTPPSYIKIK